ncbi:unnamed protein product [Vitrella brassicaformis CCMP3155]|uniref:Uncharacterized protein n=1 Tax=Vitrella brassicaformis (strain CCMP3155) TaxID=1169540 RepID=A0A0G4H2W4_VITBC|nr:unnamed protein product [Vitrella brassicaformis CCMP3155]|eukprot:CEM37896.1 unnamed protein product [Vitrella brassicaformis CCMP3155]
MCDRASQEDRELLAAAIAIAIAANQLTDMDSPDMLRIPKNEAQEGKNYLDNSGRITNSENFKTWAKNVKERQDLTKEIGSRIICAIFGAALVGGAMGFLFSRVPSPVREGWAAFFAALGAGALVEARLWKGVSTVVFVLLAAIFRSIAEGISQCDVGGWWEWLKKGVGPFVVCCKRVGSCVVWCVGCCKQACNRRAASEPGEAELPTTRYGRPQPTAEQGDTDTG